MIKQNEFTIEKKVITICNQFDGWKVDDIEKTLQWCLVAIKEARYSAHSLHDHFKEVSEDTYENLIPDLEHLGGQRQPDISSNHE